MTDNFPDDVREMILAQEHLLANPGAPVEPPPTATGYLTRATLDAAFAQLMEPPRPDVERAQREMALVRWLDEQPPGTAKALLTSPYRDVGMSSAYAAVRMPDGTMAEGCGDTVEHAITDAHQHWQEQP